MQSLDRRRILTGGLALGALYAAPARAMIPDPMPLGTIRYAITRNGSQIGEHLAVLRRQDGAIHARNQIDIRVGALGLVLFRYSHISEEVRDAHGLVRIDSRTDDNGDLIRLTARRLSDRLSIDAPGGPRTTDPEILTTSLWHPGTPAARRLLDLGDGDLMRTRPAGPRRTRLDLPRVGTIEARGHRLNDPIQRVVWYDTADRLVGVDFVSREDGSRIRARATDLPPVS